MVENGTSLSVAAQTSPLSTILEMMHCGTVYPGYTDVNFSEALNMKRGYGAAFPVDILSCISVWSEKVFNSEFIS